MHILMMAQDGFVMNYHLDPRTEHRTQVWNYVRLYTRQAGTEKKRSTLPHLARDDHLRIDDLPLFDDTFCHPARWCMRIIGTS